MRDEPTLPMTGRTVLITGGTGGIGKATALRLTGTGPSVSIIGRDPGRTATTAHEIHAQAGAGQHVHAFTADLSSQSEVRRVAAEVLAALPRIEVLINNVGGYWNTRHTSVDGIEHTFAVSHMAPYLLTNLLVERLVATGSARIVNVASNAQALGRIDFDDLQGERGYSGARAYHQSKLANVLFTYELARRLATRRVRATPCTREWSVPDSERRIPDASHGFLVPVARPFMPPPSRGADTSVLLASDPSLDGVTGRYFARGKLKKSSPRSYDQSVARRLWQTGEQLLKSGPVGR